MFLHGKRGASTNNVSNVFAHWSTMGTGLFLFCRANCQHRHIVLKTIYTVYIIHSLQHILVAKVDIRIFVC